MFKCARQQLITNPATLIARGDEQFGQKPQVAADPNQGKTHYLPIGFGHPQFIGKKLEICWPQSGHRPKAMTFRQVVDAANDKLLRWLQFVGAWGPKDD